MTEDTNKKAPLEPAYAAEIDGIAALREIIVALDPADFWLVLSALRVMMNDARFTPKSSEIEALLLELSEKLRDFPKTLEVLGVMPAPAAKEQHD